MPSMASFAPSPTRLSRSLADQRRDSSISSPSSSASHEHILASNEGSVERQTHARLPWRPFYLCRSVLGTFTVVFLAIIAAVEGLAAISNERRGVANGRVKDHYLWTYGPTAYFTLLAAIWGRVEYQSKLYAPWIRLSKEPTEARRSLTLDYVSDCQLVVLLKGIYNKDFAVSIIVLVSILIKGLIIVSTGLTTLSWISISQQRLPMSTQDEFGDIQLPVSAPLASYVIKGLIDYNLTYPDGISSDYVFQSAIADTDRIPGQAEIQTTVDALKSTFSCQPIDVRLDIENFDKLLPASEDFRGAPKDIIELVFQTPACNTGSQTMRFYRPQWSCEQSHAINPGENCTVTFSRADSVPCGGQIMLAIFGNLTFTYPLEPKKQPYRIELTKSTQIICSSTTDIMKVNVAYNGTHPTAITPLALPSNTTSSSLGRRLGVESTRQIIISSFESHFQGKNRSDLVSVDLSGVAVDTDLIMRNALKMQSNLTPNISTATLFEYKSLEAVFTRYMKQCNAVVVKQYMMVKRKANTEGIITANDTRILIQQSATRWISGLAALCALLTGAAMFFVPTSGILPCSPTTPLGIASLILHSHKLLMVLCHSMNTSSISLNHLLRSSKWKSDVTPGHRSSQAQFSIQDGTDSNPEEKGMVSSPHDTKSQPKHPLFLRPATRIAAGVILAVAITILEALLHQSNQDNGLRNVDDDRYIHYTWTTIPAVIFGLIGIIFSCMDFSTRSLAPYTSLEQNTPVEMLSTLEFLDGIIPRVLYRELKVRNLGAFLMTVTSLIGSLLATFSASLFHLLPVTTTSDTSLQVARFLNSHPDYSSEEAGIINSLILQANMSFPKFTYGHLAFPELSAETPGVSRTDIDESIVSVKAIVPALRVRMECRTYHSNDMRANYTYTNLTQDYSSSSPWRRTGDMDILQVSIKEEECITNTGHMNTSRVASLYTIQALRSPLSQGYLGVAAVGNQNSSACSDILYLWGYTNPNRNISNPIKHIAAMGCNVSYEAVDVDTTFTGPDLRIDPAHPPQPHEHTAEPVRLANPSDRHAIYGGLETFHDRAAGDSRDSFFSILTSSSWAIPISYLNDSSADLMVAAAINFQHGIIEAQALSMSKIPANQANMSNVVNLGRDLNNLQNTHDGKINITYGSRLRVVQDASSTRILEGLLGGVLVLFILSCVFMLKTDAMTCEPTTIASTAALIARGNLLEMMPEDAAWMSMEDILAAFPQGTRFRMGWSKMEVSREMDGESMTSDGLSLVEEVKAVEQFGIVAVFDNV